MNDKVQAVIGDKIKDMPEGFEEEFRKGHQTQLRCGKNKKYTKLMGSKVYKGPYNLDEPKLIQNVLFSWCLQYLEGPEFLDLPPEERSYIPIEQILRSEKSVYLQFDNIGESKGYETEYKTTTTEPEGAQIIKRGSHVHRVIDLDDPLDPKVAKAAISHLFLRRALKIGDSGFHNIIIFKSGPQLVAGIDMEEFNSKTGAKI